MASLDGPVGRSSGALVAGTAKKRRDQRARATAGKVGWLTNLLQQSCSHHTSGLARGERLLQTGVRASPDRLSALEAQVLNLQAAVARLLAGGHSPQPHEYNAHCKAEPAEVVKEEVLPVPAWPVAPPRIEPSTGAVVTHTEDHMQMPAKEEVEQEAKDEPMVVPWALPHKPPTSHVVAAAAAHGPNVPVVARSHDPDMEKTYELPSDSIATTSDVVRSRNVIGPNCLNGHRMLHIPITFGGICFECGTSLKVGDTVHACKQCDQSLCWRCAHRLGGFQRQAHGSTADWYTSSWTSWRGGGWG